MVLETLAFIGVIAKFFSDAFSTVFDFFSQLPFFMQMMVMSAVFFMDKDTNVIGGTFSVVTNAFHLTITSQFLFVLTFVMGCLFILFQVNNWFQGG